MEILPVLIDVIDELPQEVRGLFSYAVICEDQEHEQSEDFKTLLQNNPYANAIWDLMAWNIDYFRNFPY